jgi:hypothetical protein
MCSLLCFEMERNLHLWNILIICNSDSENGIVPNPHLCDFKITTSFEYVNCFCGHRILISYSCSKFLLLKHILQHENSCLQILEIWL